MQEIILKLSLLGTAITSSIILLTFFTPFYSFRFESYEVYEAFEEKWSREQVDHEFSNIQKYLLPFRSSDLNPDFFSREDILHMKDVKTIYTLVYVLFAISFLSLVGSLYLARKEKTSLKVDRFEIGILALVIVSTMVTIISFSGLFEAFHKITFNNDYWLLDPDTSNLIKYFPESVFKELLFLLIILTVSFYLLFFKTLDKVSRS